MSSIRAGWQGVMNHTPPSRIGGGVISTTFGRREIRALPAPRIYLGIGVGGYLPHGPFHEEGVEGLDKNSIRNIGGNPERRSDP
jgi:hypothetical protein